MWTSLNCFAPLVSFVLVSGKLGDPTITEKPWWVIECDLHQFFAVVSLWIGSLGYGARLTAHLFWVGNIQG
jgi:hypothetical protein